MRFAYPGYERNNPSPIGVRRHVCAPPARMPSNARVLWPRAGARSGGWGRGQVFRRRQVPRPSPPAPLPEGEGCRTKPDPSRAERRGSAGVSPAGRWLLRQGSWRVATRRTSPAPWFIPGAEQAAHGCAAVANAVRAVSRLARGDAPILASALVHSRRGRRNRAMRHTPALPRLRPEPMSLTLLRLRLRLLLLLLSRTCAPDAASPARHRHHHRGALVSGGASCWRS